MSTVVGVGDVLCCRVRVQCDFYWGPLTSVCAEAVLEGRADGSFLLRDSGHDQYILALSFRANARTFHSRIEYHRGVLSRSLTLTLTLTRALSVGAHPFPVLWPLGVG